MSEKNVETLRRGFAAFNRGDLDEAASIFHVDAEWVPYLGTLAGKTHRGRDAIVKMWADMRAHLSGFQIKPEEFIDAGEKIVVVVDASAAGTGSGAEVRDRWAQVWSFSEGLVAHVEPFPSREEALEAAGLAG